MTDNGLCMLFVNFSCPFCKEKLSLKVVESKVNACACEAEYEIKPYLYSSSPFLVGFVLCSFLIGSFLGQLRMSKGTTSFDVYDFLIDIVVYALYSGILSVILFQFQTLEFRKKQRD